MRDGDYQDSSVVGRVLDREAEAANQEVPHTERARLRTRRERPAIRVLCDCVQRAHHFVAQISAKSIATLFVPGGQVA
jgi:hypothetical protein